MAGRVFGSRAACTGSICSAYASDLSDGGTSGSRSVHGRGILVKYGSTSGADGSGQM